MTRPRNQRPAADGSRWAAALIIAASTAVAEGRSAARPASLHASPRALEARIFPLDGGEVPVFRFRSEETMRVEALGTEVRRTYRLVSRFTSISGEPALSETYEAASSSSPSVEERESYLYEQKQTGETGLVERVGNKVTYRFTGGDGRVREARETVSADWAPGPGLQRRLRSNWRSILEGRPLAVRIAVPDRLESYAFEFRPDVATLPAGRDPRGVRLWLEPRVFWIRLLVRPIEVWMSPDGSGPRAIRGRTLLKWRKGGSLADFSGFISFGGTGGAAGT